MGIFAAGSGTSSVYRNCGRASSRIFLIWKVFLIWKEGKGAEAKDIELGILAKGSIPEDPEQRI